MIDATCKIHPSAEIAEGVEIGPWTVIGARVRIGEKSKIASHVVIGDDTHIGEENHIFQFASVGEVPQDKKFHGEQTFLKIGDRNQIREFCTLNRGTIQDQGMTQIGNDNLLMAYVHIAHDCIVGNRTVFANNASLAGHAKVDDDVVLGGFSGVFQFCHVGQHAFAAAGSIIIKDVPPFIKVSGHFAKPFGLNKVGLERSGYTSQQLNLLRKAYKIIYRLGLATEDAIAELKNQFGDAQEILKLIEFIQHSKSGIIR